MADHHETVCTIADVLRPFLRPHEKVFLCYFASPGCTLGESTADAVVLLGGEIVRWDGQRHWQALLRQVFSQRATVLIGAPKLILGLAKIARATGTPLPVRHVVLLGSAKEDWLRKGIQDSLDAQIHICDLALSASCMGKTADPLVRQLDERLLSWSSVLDYCAKRKEQGLSLEIIVFPGRQLPQLPSGACITVRPWQPKEDVPFCLHDG